MRNTGLLPVTSAEQGRWQVCRDAVSMAKTQENLKLLLWIPQQEEVSPSPVWAKLDDHHGNWKNVTPSRPTEARERLSVLSMNISSNLKGVHLGREAVGGRTPKVSHGSFCTIQAESLFPAHSGKSVTLEITHSELCVPG